jgi:hypothetical protein
MLSDWKKTRATLAHRLDVGVRVGQQYAVGVLAALDSAGAAYDASPPPPAPLSDQQKQAATAAYNAWQKAKTEAVNTYNKALRAFGVDDNFVGADATLVTEILLPLRSAARSYQNNAGMPPAPPDFAAPPLPQDITEPLQVALAASTRLLAFWDMP